MEVCISKRHFYTAISQFIAGGIGKWPEVSEGYQGKYVFDDAVKERDDRDFFRGPVDQALRALVMSY